MNSLQHILDLFGRATGMLINVRKSTLSMHNMSLIDVGFYGEVFPYEQQDLDLGLKYLGFQLKPNKYKKRRLVLANSKVGKNIEDMELQRVIKSRLLGVGQIISRSHTSLLDGSSLFSKRALGQNQKIMFQIFVRWT